MTRKAPIGSAHAQTAEISAADCASCTANSTEYRKHRPAVRGDRKQADPDRAARLLDRRSGLEARRAGLLGQGLPQLASQLPGIPGLLSLQSTRPLQRPRPALALSSG